MNLIIIVREIDLEGVFGFWGIGVLGFHQYSIHLNGCHVYSMSYVQLIGVIMSGHLNLKNRVKWLRFEELISELLEQ